MNLKTLLLIQGTYYLLTGLWPIIHFKSFEHITGDKKDHWLVYTVSLLLICSSAVFLYSGLTEVPFETIILSLTNCLALAFIDIYFSLKKVIRKVYLVESFIELLIFVGVIYVGAGNQLV